MACGLLHQAVQKDKAGRWPATNAGKEQTTGNRGTQNQQVVEGFAAMAGLPRQKHQRSYYLGSPIDLTQFDADSASEVVQ